MASPEPRRDFNGNDVLWEIGRVVVAYRAPLSNEKPSAMTQHDEGGQVKGVL